MIPKQNQAVLEQVPESGLLSEAISSLAQNMITTMDTSRRDRLWPADAMVFQTNPLNVAYGACGTALFLHSALGELPPQARDWLLGQPVDLANYPPGLYSGIAGIAWSFAELGMMDRAIELFKLVPQSSLAYQTADIFNGVAGWGMAALALYLRTGNAWLMKLACEAGDYLVKTAEADSKGSFWTDRQSNDVPLGFAFGGSGIALFLLYLSHATGDPRYLRLAREAIDFDIAHAQVQGEALVWGSSVRSLGNRPYWLRGGAGVTTALVRFAQLLGESRYLDLARKAARPCGSFFSAAPHLFEGLASMGESLLDMFLVTGDESYLQKARQKATQTLLFKIDRPEDIAFPGRYLFKISHDYGVGGAGIGLFLIRLVRLAPRTFHDLFSLQEFRKGNAVFSPTLIFSREASSSS
jgi:Lanthionine synthetase C-like protein